MNIIAAIRELWGALTGELTRRQLRHIRPRWFWRRSNEDRQAWRRRVWCDGYWPWWMWQHMRSVISFCREQWEWDPRAVWIVLAIRSPIMALVWPFLPDSGCNGIMFNTWYIQLLKQQQDELRRVPDEYEDDPLRITHVLGLRARLWPKLRDQGEKGTQRREAAG